MQPTNLLKFRETGRVQHHSRDTIVEIERVKTSPEAERRWPLRRRIGVIVGLAALCWAIPLAIAYLLLGR
jgi:hypothetical protein